MRLSDLEMEAVGRGFVVRMPGIEPYEEVVDFMLVLLPTSELCFVVSSGYQAGHTVVVLPSDAHHPGTGMLSVEWIKENWNRWVMSEIAVSEVEVLLKYPVPLSISFA